MNDKASKQETEYGSVIYALRKVHWAEALPSFLVSLAYPFQVWILHATKVQKKLRNRLLFDGLGVALTIIIGVYAIDPLLNWVGLSPLIWYKKFAAVILLTASCNILFYVIVLLFDLHKLFYVSFRNAGNESVSGWFTHILGHKLWAGKNIYLLLEDLLKESPALGRAKWLLVGFLSTDIDKKIQRDPDKKADFNGKLNDKLKPIHPIYKVTVHDWSVQTYSNFLAENMTHAKRSIHWVVDPVDLIVEIIPAHVVEVIVSLGSFFRGDVDSKVREAKLALGDSALSINWGTLLGPYAKWCPRPRARSKETSRCSKEHTNCPDSFPFSSESSHRQLDYLWYAIFAGTLADLKDAVVVRDKIKMKSGKIISWTNIRKSYIKREEIVGSLVLPHIDEFRKATCSKKRHVYLGTKPTNIQKKEDRITKAVKNLKSYVTWTGSYVSCISPQPAESKFENGLFSTLLYNNTDASGKVTYKQPSGEDDIWANVSNDIKTIIIRWGIKLLAYTSGGEKFIKGVFLSDRPKDLDYEDCHDIGFYDGLLVLSSGRGKKRDVAWRVYQETPQWEKAYFPNEEPNRVVNFDELAEIITGMLQ